MPTEESNSFNIQESSQFTSEANVGNTPQFNSEFNAEEIDVNQNVGNKFFKKKDIMAIKNKTLLGTVKLTGSATDTYLGVASPLTANIQQATVRVLCDTASGVVNFTLPEISTYKGLYQGLKIMIVDSGGASAVSNITLTAASGDTIEGNPSITIEVNQQVLLLRVADNLLWERSA
mgnify:FL=1|jgi:hypothetical protein|tara:strand:+ start:7573 stop:8100 length:528 start_codon:yes stop_codon:yes gene_type:complete